MLKLIHLARALREERRAVLARERAEQCRRGHHVFGSWSGAYAQERRRYCRHCPVFQAQPDLRNI